MRIFRDIFQYYLNTGKHTCGTLAEKSGISVARLNAFLTSSASPELEELSLLADALAINPADLMPDEINTENGIRYMNAQESKATIREIYRKKGNRSIHYYSYRDTAFSKSTPHARGVILDIRCTAEDDVVQNNGHFQDALTLVLKGKIKGYWVDGDGRSFSRVLETGHSYFARGYVPHTYRSFSDQDIGQILSFTFTQHIPGGVQKELSRLGNDRAIENIASKNPYGNLLTCHINNSMLTIPELANATGIEQTRIKAFIESSVTPAFYELDAIANALDISTGELIPVITDSENGLIHLTQAESLKKLRRLHDAQRMVRYEVRDLANTKEASNFRAHHITVLGDTASPNTYEIFSTEHTLLFVLKNQVRLMWLFNGQSYSTELQEYDSVYIEPFIRFTLTSSDRGEVVRFQYPSLSAGDARKEMSTKGISAICRLVSEQHPWADKQT
uniref:Cro/C1-type HTH DNA-binding domain/Helix-turn-helix n=1 Tax=Candidatus Kentrum sp. TUN TaxID=2126343 RepID=A0A451AA24_9GAMM|nr:MAG: Cro/C1-type HTH DNA-binding domain/Helix-turn-helix [Candidatus Kentron sp. TUN]VFK62884.1 MAG: Cro/C1-type HTH DNA-binding domain/Helix-turn-helix [Candidatus Kentron sp. TUN]